MLVLARDTVPYAYVARRGRFEMTGEMSQAEVTRENYPELYALRDALKRRGIASEPRAFDQYQGPYLAVPGVGQVWYSQDDDAAAVWLSSGKPLYPGGLWLIEHRHAFETTGAMHVHEATERSYAAGCFTIRQASKRIARLAQEGN